MRVDADDADHGFGTGGVTLVGRSPMASSARMNDLWQRCLAHLESEFSAPDLYTWLHPLQPVQADGELRLLAPNEFVADQVRTRFLPRIEELARALASGPLQVRVGLGSREPGRSSDRPVAAGRSTPVREPFDSNLDPRYTFDNFIEGKSNELGKAAAFRVGMNPGGFQNPLLLYGSTGLGKTHLMHAAGNLMRERNPGMRVLYQRSEQFVTTAINALRGHTMDEFKRRYHTVDALLLDDIQFIAGKERTQEEFFHTFNALFDSQQQIVLSCDRYPKEVEKFEPRLTSRLGWGLSVAIEPPDFETRAAILLRKADEMGLRLPEEVALLIARRMRSNVRELEGGLRTLEARAHFTGRAISIEFAQETLRDLLAAQDRAISLENILRTVAAYYQLRVMDLISRKRTRALAHPRQLAMALAKELTEHSLPEIGEAFGGRDHTTVIHACRAVRSRLLSDGTLSDDWHKLIRQLTG